MVREGRHARTRRPRVAAGPAGRHAGATASPSRLLRGARGDRALRGHRGAVHRSRRAGAPTPSCSTTSSPTATASRTPSCEVVGDVCATATTRSRVRPGEPDLRPRSTRRSRRSPTSGELQRILDAQRSIWNERQARLVDVDRPRDRTQMLGAAAAARRRLRLGPRACSSCRARRHAAGLDAARWRSRSRSACCSRSRGMYGGRGAAARLAGAYVEIYRGTPVLLQLYLLYYGLAPVLTARRADRRHHRARA